VDDNTIGLELALQELEPVEAPTWVTLVASAIINGTVIISVVLT